MKPILEQLLAAQPNALARRNAAREYLQARILQMLQDGGAFLRWAFIGGTALRFLYGMPRFSEDLDFSLAPGIDEIDFQKILGGVKAAFEAEAFAVEIKANDRKTVHAALIRFPGLPQALGFSARRTEVLAVRLEVDTRPPEGAKLETTLVRRHATLNLSHYDKGSLFAGKLHAILARPWLKGRDLYDLAWYLADRTWPAPNLELLNNALKQTEWKGAPLATNDWRRAILNRLELANWKDALEDVRPFLERERDLDLLTLENFRKLLHS